MRKRSGCLRTVTFIIYRTNKSEQVTTERSKRERRRTLSCCRVRLIYVDTALPYAINCFGHFAASRAPHLHKTPHGNRVSNEQMVAVSRSKVSKCQQGDIQRSVGFCLAVGCGLFMSIRGRLGRGNPHLHKTPHESGANSGQLVTVNGSRVSKRQ